MLSAVEVLPYIIDEEDEELEESQLPLLQSDFEDELELEQSLELQLEELDEELEELEQSLPLQGAGAGRAAATPTRRAEARMVEKRIVKNLS